MVGSSMEGSQDAETVAKRLRHALDGGTDLSVEELEGAVDLAEKVEQFPAVLRIERRHAIAIIKGNLGLVLRREGHGTAADLERSLELLQSSLADFHGVGNSEHLAYAHLNVGAGFELRQNGNPEQNVDSAIVHYYLALRVFRRGGELPDVVDTRRSIVRLYLRRERGSRDRNLHRALGQYAALVEEVAPDPGLASAIRRELENVQQIISEHHSESARPRSTADPDADLRSDPKPVQEPEGLLSPPPEAHGEDHFREVNPNLDASHALRRSIKGGGPQLFVQGVTGVKEGYEKAMELLNASTNAMYETDTERRLKALLGALELAEASRDDEKSADIIKTQKGLLLGSVGEALLARRHGEVSKNRRDAIEYYKRALHHFEDVGDKHNQLKTLYNLADAHASGPAADARTDLPLALTYLREVIAYASSVLDFQISITARLNFAGYVQRLDTPDAASWVEEAIRHAKDVVDAVPRDRDPSIWASGQNTLGSLYARRQEGEPRANLETAIRCIQKSLEVRTKERAPEQWAVSSHNLIQLLEKYNAHFDGDRNADAGIDQTGDELVEHLTKAGRPLVAAGTALGLAKLALGRARGNRMQPVVRARELLQRAVAVFTQHGALADQVEAFRLLFEIELSLGDRRAAAHCGLQALFVSAQLEFGGFELERVVEISRSLGDLHARVAVICTELQEGAAALQALELGRARFLRAALRTQTQQNSAVQKTIGELRSSVLSRERELSQGSGTWSRSKLEEFARLREKLASLITTGARQSVLETWDTATDLLSTFDAIVVPVFSGVGAMLAIFALHEGKLLLSAAHLERRPRTILARWLAAYEKNASGDSRALVSAIDMIGDDLWDLFGETMVVGLYRRGVPAGARVVIIPPAALGVLPLGLARAPETGVTLLEIYELSIAPNIESLAKHRKDDDQRSLAAIVNPTKDLLYSEFEARVISSLFPENARKVVQGASCSRDTTLEALRGRNFWLMSTHGTFDHEDPRRSGLTLAAGDTLSFDDLLTSTELGSPRLVALSACETGLHDVNQEEFVGLPVVFLQMGAGAVLSTLWPVNDASTALLVSRFFQGHVKHGLRPAKALREAQLWLRELTVGEYRELVDATLAAEPRHKAKESLVELVHAPANVNSMSRPFSHPYHWGGFALHGA